MPRALSSLFLFFVLLLGASGCSRVAFTDKAAAIFTEEQLPRVQIHTRGRIELRRLITSDSAELTDAGRLVTERGRSWEIVVIPRGTPGQILGRTDDGGLEVSFEEGTSLPFRRLAEHLDPGDDQYVLATWFDGAKRMVEFKGNVYEVTPTSRGAHLAYDRIGRVRVERDRERLRGVRVE
jgi:hypothetical protein